MITRKKMMPALLLTTIGIFSSFLLQSNAEKSFHLKAVLQSMRPRFAGFLDNVLRQLSSQEFYSAIDKLMVNTHLDDAACYNELRNNRDKLIPRLPFYSQITLLRYQKELLGAQAMQLLNSKKTYNNLLEIGTPGTYTSALINRIKHTGTITVINEKKQYSDILQAGAFRPLNGFVAYDRFVPLNNYEPISTTIADGSIDLIVCFIGLHHIPAEKIEPFVASIARVMKPNGTFLLREHDCIDKDTHSIIYGAHSIYNLVIPGESQEAESAEVRNFQPLAYWISLLEKHGFSVGNKRICQEGDPSLNTMIACTKIASPLDIEKERTIAQAKELIKNIPYERELQRTYLTAPEWYNVDSSQAYGKFINHTPFYAFPYIKSVAVYWQVYLNAIRASLKKGNFLNLQTLDAHLMNLFVGISMSVEYIAKSIISAPVRWLYNGTEAETIHMIVNDPDESIEKIDPLIKTIHPHTTSSVKAITVPRYKKFLEIINKLADSSIEIIEIAGNYEIACKIAHRSNQPIDFTCMPDCTFEYNWQLPTDQKTTYAVVTVQVNRLKEFVMICRKHKINLLYVHDY